MKYKKLVSYTNETIDLQKYNDSDLLLIDKEKYVYLLISKTDNYVMLLCHKDQYETTTQEKDPLKLIDIIKDALSKYFCISSFYENYTDLHKQYISEKDFLQKRDELRLEQRREREEEEQRRERIKQEEKERQEKNYKDSILKLCQFLQVVDPETPIHISGETIIHACEELGINIPIRTKGSLYRSSFRKYKGTGNYCTTNCKANFQPYFAKIRENISTLENKFN